MTIAHPSGGEIQPMKGERGRFQHVIKHLYASCERWHLAVPTLPADLAQRALKAGCCGSDLRNQDFSSSAPACVRHVREDHDQYLRPAYETALVNAISQQRYGAYEHEGEVQHAFVGSKGCYIVVGPNRSDPDHHVITAFRVLPPGVRRGSPVVRRGPPAVEGRAFFRAAVHRLRDLTSYGEVGE